MSRTQSTNVVALAELATSEPATRVTWVTRREGAAGVGGPIAVIENDRLPQRHALAKQANQLAGGGGVVTYWPRSVVERIARTPADNSFDVELSGDHAGVIQVEEIIANVGFRPDHHLYNELQIQPGLISPDFLRSFTSRFEAVPPVPSLLTISSRSFRFCHKFKSNVVRPSISARG